VFPLAYHLASLTLSLPQLACLLASLMSHQRHHLMQMQQSPKQRMQVAQ
jgi:hypothetical protein